MRTDNVDSNYRMPLKVSGRRRKGEGDSSSWLNVISQKAENNSASGMAQHNRSAIWDNIPVEIQAEDSVSYVRLLTEEALVHDVTAELASHFGNAKFVWTLDENRLSVTADIENVPAESVPAESVTNDPLPGEIRWPTAASLSGPDENDRDMFRRENTTQGNPLSSQRSFVPARIPPLVKDARPRNDTILPPPPPGRTMQPVLALQSVLADTERNAAVHDHGDSLQTVRTSMPPAHLRPERSDTADVIKVMAVTTLAVAAIMFMLSTPLHQKPVTDSGPQQTFSSFESPQVMPQGAQLLSVPAAAIAVSDSTMPAAIPTAIPSMHFSTQEVAAAGDMQNEAAALDGDAAAAHSSEKNGRQKRMHRAKRRAKPPVAHRAEASKETAANAAVIGNPTVEQLLAGAQSAAPARPSRKMVQAAMRQVSPRVAQCRTTVSGRMDMIMTFAGATGRLVSAQVVDNTFRDTPAADCALRAVRHVQLPTFAHESIKIKYPFYL